MVGKRLGQYEITKPLGAGGMGEVYRAHDTNLKRDVAIKVLPEALAVDTERLARLQREARLLASVNHPNIATIHNLEEADGIRWLVLELIEGTTLEEMLRRGALSTDEALRVGVQVASALEAAHEKGIVHRDLKSANVMLDEKGRVKVLDFGIAKDISGGGSAEGEGDAARDLMDTSLATQVNKAATHLTATGVIVGTAPYMSPEQIRGRNIDKRTDNWAFGCLMYELLTGRRPFDRETMADTLAAILEYEPDWDRLPADTSPALRSLIGRCLQKDADSRLHDIADARVELEHIEATGVGAHGGTRRGAAAAPSRRPSRPGWQLAGASVVTLLVVLAAGWGVSSMFSGAGSDAVEATAANSGDGTGGAMLIADAPAPNSIAILPFESRSDDAEDGFAEELGAEVQRRLQTVSGMTVISRYSSVRFKDQLSVGSSEIGRELKAAHLLYGIVTTDGDMRTVDVELVEVSSGTVLWSETYPAVAPDLDSRLGVQVSIARQVVAVLEVGLVGGEEARLATRPTESLQAYEAYIAGKRVQQLRSRGPLEESLRHFRRAVALDPEFALAYVGVADTYLFLASYAGMDKEVAYDQTQRNIDVALALDPDLGEAVRVQADLLARRGDGRWEATMDRAIALNPNDSRAHDTYGSPRRVAEREPGALRLRRRAFR